MLFRDLGIALPETTASGRIDQCPGLVARRVLEGGTARSAAQRLRFLASAGDRLHLGTDRFRLARFALEGRLDDDRAGRHFAVAVGVSELFPLPFDDFAGTQDDTRRDPDVTDLPALSTAVHAHEATNGSGYPAKEFKTGNAMVARRRGHEDPARSTAAAYRDLVQLLDLRERLAEPHNNPW